MKTRMVLDDDLSWSLVLEPEYDTEKALFESLSVGTSVRCSISRLEGSLYIEGPGKHKHRAAAETEHDMR